MTTNTQPPTDTPKQAELLPCTETVFVKVPFAEWARAKTVMEGFKEIVDKQITFVDESYKSHINSLFGEIKRLGRLLVIEKERCQNLLQEARNQRHPSAREVLRSVELAFLTESYETMPNCDAVDLLKQIIAAKLEEVK